VSRRTTLAALAATLAAACVPAEDAPAPPAGAPAGATLPETVRIADPGLHPEGIEYDAAGGRFLVSSVTRGTVTRVGDDGTHSVFIDDPDIVSSIGIHIDPPRNRVLVANSDVSSFQGGGGHARLGAYELDSGARLFMADLGATVPSPGHFANDIAVGPDGTAYVTDSMTPVIYAVSTDGSVSTLLRDGVLADGGFLNGIDYHPDGFLLVALAGARALVRVPLDEPGAAVRVGIPEPLGIDGLVLAPDGRLIAVTETGEGETARTEVVALSSEDGWVSASIVDRSPAASDATTATVRDGVVYVVDARFAAMGGDVPAPHFDITRVRFR
jgi:sugar lactone lactonase YvrE